MKTTFGKKKVPLPSIQIFDYVPYTLMPLGVEKPYIPFTHLNKPEETPHAKIPKPVSKSPKPPVKYSQDPKENKKKLISFV